MKIVNGNILEASEDYIVQQCCCTALRAAGLSKAIATKWSDANPYANRHPIKKGGNTAIESERAVPGTVAILGIRKIACLYGQWAPGKPSGTVAVHDLAKDRHRYFESALRDLISKVPETASFAIPHGIGCGMAGGHWPTYLSILQRIETEHPRLTVVLYRLE